MVVLNKILSQFLDFIFFYVMSIHLTRFSLSSIVNYKGTALIYCIKKKPQSLNNA